MPMVMRLVRAAGGSRGHQGRRAVAIGGAMVLRHLDAVEAKGLSRLDLLQHLAIDLWPRSFPSAWIPDRKEPSKLEAYSTLLPKVRCNYQSAAEARRAPSVRDWSLAQAILASTLRPQADVPKPQSVLAITRSRPTTSA